ncbi:MAG: alpha-N-arabinofuranosidase [Kiritimatiellae bacterium]|nr:alpha-N-arabinofuranosidase [Kiritimatiellia bacterium]
MESEPVKDTAGRDASLTPVKDAKEIVYSPMIFGHFLEHFDTQVYGGIFDPGSPLSDEDGFRKDVIAALREIKTPIVRWPGGCFVSDYHWKYGVGPKREPMWNKAWAVEEPNTFGTDEYVKWCRKVGCKPYICTNAGTGNAEEMSDWVEYCNLSVGKWGRIRIANGFASPHEVLYWSVGNENWGRHEIGAKTVDEWGPLVRESAKMMRGTDRRIRLFAAALPDEKWTLPLLKHAGYLLDYVSVHGYYVWGGGDNPYLKCMMRTTAPEADIMRTIGVLEKAGFGGGKIAIAFDEWNLRGWYHPGLGNFRRDATMDYEARRKNDIASTYTMADALFSACFLNTCLRHSDVVKMANFSPAVNTRGAIFVHRKGIVKRTSYHVFWMYTHLLEPKTIQVKTECGNLTDGKTNVPVLDAVLTVSDDGKRHVLAVVNKHPSQEIALDVSSFLMAATPDALRATVLAGDSPDAYNDIGNENRVVPKQVSLPVSNGKVKLPPHSLSCIRLE